MTARIGRICIAMLLAASVAACGANRKDPDLMNIKRGQNSPDEFTVLPTKPLVVPEDLTALPPPNVGAPNRVDPTPKADAVAALGGNPARLQRTGTPRSDGALVSRATRFGVDPTIREDLAAADLDFRRRNNGLPLERLFNVTVYFKAYRKQSLDQHAELERFRRAGVRTVGAPPEGAN